MVNGLDSGYKHVGYLKYVELALIRWHLVILVLQLKQKSLELKIAELKIEQNEEKVAHEQAQIKVYAEKISQLLETEKSLRQQLTADGEKFQQFQVSITLSVGMRIFIYCLFIYLFI